MLKTKGLDFRRANFSVLRAELEEIPLTSMEDKGASECWEFFENNLLNPHHQFFATIGKGSGENKSPPWLNPELLGLLRTKMEMYQRWKSGISPLEDYKGITRICRDAVRKAKPQLEQG